jgi:hypothetical protein
MKKGSTSFINLSLLKNCVKYDVLPAWNLLIGFPGELEDVYRKYTQDIPLLMHLPPPFGVFPVRFDRYSPYFVQAKEFGLNLQPAEFYELMYPFDRDSLANMAYYFMDQNFDADYFIHMMTWYGELVAKVTEWKERWPLDDSSRRAQLFREDQNGTTCVHDSRSGNAKVFPLGGLGSRLLDQLETPTIIANLPGILGEAAEEMDRELTRLRDRGLIFEEGGRALSLVMPRRP